MTTSDWTRRGLLRAGLQGGGLAGAAMGGATFARASTLESDPPKIQRRVSLGKTGLEIPDICFGTFSLESDEALVLHALDRGITHFDTAESYTEGRAEAVLGRALQDRRHDVTITTKYWAEADSRIDDQMAKLEGSLRRLKTDYIDVYLNHAVNEVARLESEEWQAFVERAKAQGKIRHVGMSGHAARLSSCLEYALDHQLVDVILVAYNFSQQPSFKQSLKQFLQGWVPSLDLVSGQPALPGLLARASSEGVGVMVMKTLKGARKNDMRPFEAPGRTFSQAAFRWVLSEPAVDGLVVTMTSPEMVDEYVEASGGGEPDREDLALLARYQSQNVRTSCLVGCAECSDACPLGVPIAEMMRLRMYDVDYDQPERATQESLRRGLNASACLSCSGEPCASACPAGLPIPELLRETARRLAGA